VCNDVDEHRYSVGAIIYYALVPTVNGGEGVINYGPYNVHYNADAPERK